MRRWVVAVAVTAAVLVGVAGRGMAADPSLLAPEGSFMGGFYSGNEWMLKDKLFRLAYVAGVLDTLGVISAESTYLARKDSPPLSLRLGVFGSALEAGWPDQETVQILAERVSQERFDELQREWEKRRPGTAALVVSVKAGALYALSSARGVTLGQLHDVAYQYLQDHPAERHNNAALLLWRALAEADWR